MSHAFTDYPGAREVQRRFDALMKLPPVALRRDAMRQHLQRLETKCAKSKAMIAEAKQFSPGGVHLHLSFHSPLPLVMERTERPHLEGNRYMDFLQAGETVRHRTPSQNHERI